MTTNAAPRILWVTRSFLDYRVPVFQKLDELVGGRLQVLYADRWTPPRVQAKLHGCLGGRAMALSGERSLGEDDPRVANSSVCVPYQPGLLSAIQRCEPDVLIGDGFFQWTYAALLQRLRRGTPLVVCYERTAHTDRQAQWYRLAYRKLVLPLIDAMCCNGELCGEHSRHLGMPGDRITYGHMVADTAGLVEAGSRVSAERIDDLRAALGLDGVVYLYVGKLVRMKGLRELLSAWRESFGRDPRKATLLVVGEGEERGCVAEFCRVHELKNVHLKGAVDYDRIAEFYAAADALVMPTLEDNWSLVVPEAMACGLPILCSKYNGCWPELVTERNGWVFDPLDPRDTADCLRRALDAKEALQEMGAASREIVSRHTPERAAEAILEACRIALRHRRRQAAREAHA